MMNESPERKPICRCRRINPADIGIEEGDEATKAFILSLLHFDELQAYSVYRFDTKSTATAFYHPIKQALVIFHNSAIEKAIEIADLFQGLKWWIQEPEIWQEHVVE